MPPERYGQASASRKKNVEAKPSGRKATLLTHASTRAITSKLVSFHRRLDSTRLNSARLVDMLWLWKTQKVGHYRKGVPFSSNQPLRVSFLGIMLGGVKTCVFTPALITISRAVEEME